MSAFDYVEIDTVAASDGAGFLMPDYLKGIAEIKAPDSLLLAFTLNAMGGGSISVNANAFNQLVDYPMVRTITISGFAAAGTTSTTILGPTNTFARFKNGSQFYIPSTGEVFRLPASPTSNSLTGIQRGAYFAGAVPSGTQCIFIGQVAEEFGALADPSNDTPGYRTYYVQHMHRSFALTDLAGANQTWAKMPEKVRISRKAAMEFARDINDAWLLGTPGQSDSSISDPYTATLQLYQTGGILFFARKRNHIVPGDVLTFDAVIDAATQVMSVGEPNEKVVHCDRRTYDFIARSAAKMNIARQDTSKRTLDLGIESILIPTMGRSVRFAYDMSIQRVVDARTASDGEYTGMMLILDYSQIAKVSLNGDGVRDGMIELTAKELQRYGSVVNIHSYGGISPGAEEAHGLVDGYTVMEVA